MAAAREPTLPQADNTILSGAFHWSASASAPHFSSGDIHVDGLTIIEVQREDDPFKRRQAFNEYVTDTTGSRVRHAEKQFQMHLLSDQARTSSGSSSSMAPARAMKRRNILHNAEAIDAIPRSVASL
jgi:hypothetical protein